MLHTTIRGCKDLGQRYLNVCLYVFKIYFKYVKTVVYCTNEVIFCPSKRSGLILSFIKLKPKHKGN